MGSRNGYVFNCTISHLITRNHVVHLADNCNPDENDKLAKIMPFYNLLNKKFLIYVTLLWKTFDQAVHQRKAHQIGS